MKKNLIIGFLVAALVGSWCYFLVHARTSPLQKDGSHAWVITPTKEDSFQFKVTEVKSFEIFFFDDSFVIDTLRYSNTPSFHGSFRYTGEQRFSFFDHGGGFSYVDMDGDGLTDRRAIVKTREWFLMQPPTWVPLSKENRPNKAPEPTPGSVTPRATDGPTK